MTAMSPPSTPERGLHPGMRRSFTLPIQANYSPKSPPGSSSATPDSVESLFSTALAKVVSFSSSTTSSRPSSSSGRGTVDPDKDLIGTLPWASATERTIAAGPLRIYRVPSSGVSFLHSGALLHPILPRSQCWCVDGISKFVLRIREGSFYRIELPANNSEEEAKVEEFKTVLEKVLLYEKTACPFKRGFTVELPEQPQSPIRKRVRGNSERAKRWRLSKVWEPADGSASPREEHDFAEDQISEEEDGSSTSTLDATEEDTEAGASNDEPSPLPQIRSKPLPLQRIPMAMRSVTAPPHSQKQAPEPVPIAQPISSPPADSQPRSASLASSNDTFYSVDDVETAVQPTTQGSDDDIPTLHEDRVEDDEPIQIVTDLHKMHKRDESTATLRPESSDGPAAISTAISPGTDSEAPTTPTLVSDSEEFADPPWSDVATPPGTLRLRHAPGSPHRRTFEPMTSPVNVFFTGQRSPSSKGPSPDLIQRTYSLLIGPPAHLVALMLRIAAKIASGASVIASYDLGVRKSRTPGAWESSGEEEDEWDEDDFGVPLGNVKTGSSSGRSSPGGGID
ncbi:hypothetical protein K402DRAFT_373138 [Aulographum hederae CBS 113979]|uniref:Inheritance of peroxisomes protein 1 n=1 Tax=Aulographum hederae CBS 113979 TaxID=1176131 RepID=A0A6G1H731_9PEZI|nr:hypothetical protein K402DRAFT_373138 [Aulographum hederae CBS 113979]